MAIAGTALLALAGLAWACTVQTSFLVLTRQVGPVGSRVWVGGQAVAGQPVEIRWNRVQGPALATGAAGPTGQFSVPVLIPEAKPGLYLLVAVAPGAGPGRVPFEVTAGKEEPGAVPGRAAPYTALRNWHTTRTRIDSSAGRTPAALAGAALLATGLAALVGGCLVASVRRRPLARSRSRREV